KIPEVLDAFRRSVVRATGVMCYVLVLDLLAVVLLLTAFPGLRRRRGFWRMFGGSQGLGLFAWGLLGLLRPDASVVGVGLQDVTAGGDVGHGLATSGVGALIWLVALASGFALVTPAGA